MKIVIAASLLLLTLSACSGTAQATPTLTVMPTKPPPVKTITGTPSPLPSTETPEPQPTSEWNDIPIMPGAIAGEGDEEGYVFTIKATLQQVQEYYQVELEKLGWQLLSQEQSNSSITLLFTDNASVTLTVSIISKGDRALVLLVK